MSRGATAHTDMDKGIDSMSIGNQCKLQTPVSRHEQQPSLNSDPDNQNLADQYPAFIKDSEGEESPKPGPKTEPEGEYSDLEPRTDSKVEEHPKPGAELEGENCPRPEPKTQPEGRDYSKLEAEPEGEEFLELGTETVPEGGEYSKPKPETEMEGKYLDPGPGTKPKCEEYLGPRTELGDSSSDLESEAESEREDASKDEPQASDIKRQSDELDQKSDLKEGESEFQKSITTSALSEEQVQAQQPHKELTAPTDGQEHHRAEVETLQKLFTNADKQLELHRVREAEYLKEIARLKREHGEREALWKEIARLKRELLTLKTDHIQSINSVDVGLEYISDESFENRFRKLHDDVGRSYILNVSNLTTTLGLRLVPKTFQIQRPDAYTHTRRAG